MVHKNVRLVIKSYLFRTNFSFQSNVCDGNHELLQKAMNSKETAIVFVIEKA